MIVSEQLNYIKTRRFHAIFMPVLIEFSRCIGTYSSAKFEYITYCKKIDDCKYLLSPPTCDIIYRKKVLNTRQKFTTEKMNNYHSIFEKEVVEGKYHYKVIKGKETKAGELPHIFYGDTRHLAIMNMMMQGVKIGRAHV